MKGAAGASSCSLLTNGALRSLGSFPNGEALIAHLAILPKKIIANDTFWRKQKIENIGYNRGSSV